MSYSPTQRAVLAALSAADFGIVEHRDLSRLTGHRVAWPTMAVLRRDRLVVWNVICCTWWITPRGRQLAVTIRL